MGIISEAELQSLINQFKAIVNFVVGEREEYCDHPSTLYKGRAQIGNILDELSGLINLKSLGEKAWLF